MPYHSVVARRYGRSWAVSEIQVGNKGNINSNFPLRGFWSGRISGKEDRRRAGLARRRDDRAERPSWRSGSVRNLKRLAIVHTAVNDLEAQGLVTGLREFVIDPCIRCHFDAALAPRP